MKEILLNIEKGTPLAVSALEATSSAGERRGEIFCVNTWNLALYRAAHGQAFQLGNQHFVQESI